MTAILAPVRKLRLWPLIAATYFMVSGGPYGLEDIVGSAGYSWTLTLLVVLPLVWSLPTALMVGELAGAMPEDGGFYVWVTRALGPFWGFQEAWLSLVASVFDMALYPALFVAYLGMLAPELVAGHRGIAWGAALVLICLAWNLLGAYDVGEGSRWMLVLFLLPFVAIVGLAAWHAGGAHSFGARPAPHVSPSTRAFGAALLVALWNTMGWDNASTVAREVERPQRTYIVAMLGAVALVTITYVLPIAASWAAGISAEQFATGAWVEVARRLGAGSSAAVWLPVAVTVGGCLTAVGMFNALTMSYARLPFAMAADGWLPSLFFADESAGCSVGLCARAGMRLVAGAGLEFPAADCDRRNYIWCVAAARVRRAGGVAGARAADGAAVSGTRRTRYRDFAGRAVRPVARSCRMVGAWRADGGASRAGLVCGVDAAGAVCLSCVVVEAGKGAISPFVMADANSRPFASLRMTIMRRRNCSYPV